MRVNPTEAAEEVAETVEAAEDEHLKWSKLLM